jgi:hypothetical protein
MDPPAYYAATPQMAFRTERQKGILKVLHGGCLGEVVGCQILTMALHDEEESTKPLDEMSPETDVSLAEEIA